MHVTCEQLSDLHVCGLAEQSNQSRYAPAVLQRDLVVIVGFAVHQVPQGSAGATVHVSHPMVQQVHQQLNSTLPPDLSAEKGGKRCKIRKYKALSYNNGVFILPQSPFTLPVLKRNMAPYSLMQSLFKCQPLHFLPYQPSVSAALPAFLCLDKEKM